jgi:hypothetical protein
MWIMLWVSVSAGGVLTSGTIEFPTQDACEAGKRSWGEVAVPTTERQPTIPSINLRCIQRATGKP